MTQDIKIAGLHDLSENLTPQCTYHVIDDVECIATFTFASGILTTDDNGIITTFCQRYGMYPTISVAGKALKVSIV